VHVQPRGCSKESPTYALQLSPHQLRPLEAPLSWALLLVLALRTVLLLLLLVVVVLLLLLLLVVLLLLLVVLALRCELRCRGVWKLGQGRGTGLGGGRDAFPSERSLGAVIWKEGLGCSIGAEAGTESGTPLGGLPTLDPFKSRAPDPQVPGSLALDGRG